MRVLITCYDQEDAIEFVFSCYPKFIPEVGYQFNINFTDYPEETNPLNIDLNGNFYTAKKWIENKHKTDFIVDSVVFEFSDDPVVFVDLKY